MSHDVRSIRNNNPGNIKLSGSPWEGRVSGSDPTFVTFATPAYGVRAMARTLETYQDRHGLTTVRDMIGRWAPPSENDTNGYVSFVSGQMGISPDTPIDLSANPDLQAKMLGSMIRMEGGVEAEEYFAPHLSEGIRMATGNTPSDTYVPGEGPVRGESDVIDPYESTPVDKQYERNSIPEQADFSNNISWDRLENGPHMIQNVLDQYDNYTYNLELFVLDRQETNEFLSNPNIGLQTANGSWTPNNKVLVAASGETSEIIITDLNIESVNSGSKTSVISNTATNLDFTLTRIGHGKIADVLEDAALIAGYTDISTANFFIKVDFEGYKNGQYFTIPGTTKVIPFRLSKLADIATSTDQRGTNAIIEGRPIRSIATYDATVSKLNHAVHVNGINQENAKDVLKQFIDALNKSIVENHPTDNLKYTVEYSIEFTQEFDDLFGSDLSLGIDSLSSVGTVNGQHNTSPSAGNNTTGSAMPTLDLNVGTSIMSIITDILINTESIKTALTVDDNSFSDVVSIDVEYIPKVDAYNIMTRREGAEVKYIVGVKQLLVDQNSFNQMRKILNVEQIVEEILNRYRLCKKYYYYYTGLNDQVMEFNVSLNQQLTKTMNDASTDYFDITEIDAVSEYYENLSAEEQRYLEGLRQQSSEAQANLDRAQSELESKNDSLERTAGIARSRARELYEQINRESQISAGRDPLDANMETGYQVNEYDSVPSLISFLEEQLADDGDLAGDEQLSGLLRELLDMTDEKDSIIDSLNEERDNLSDANSEELFGIETVFGESLSEDLSIFDAGRNISNLNLSDDFAVEDLTTDVRTALISEDLRPLVEVTLSSGVKFVTLAQEIIDNPLELRVASNRQKKGVELARRKFLEAYRQDISMINATMTIKGDPFWVENYKVNAREQTGGNNITTGLQHDSSPVAGPHYLMIITNTADGTDDNHNSNIKNLFRYLYTVKKINSSFSGGLFTQTLDMNKFTLATMINNIFTPPSELENNGDDISYGDDPILGEFGGITINPPSGDETSPSVEPPASDPDVDLVPPAPLPFTPPDEGIATPDFILDVLPDVTEPVPFEDRTPWTETRGSYVTLVDEIITAPFPTEDQSARFLELYEIAYASAENGNEEATNDVNSSITAMRENFGPTRNDADAIIQDIINSGEYDVSAEFLVMIDVVFGQTGSGYSNLDASTAAEYTTIIEDIGPNSFYRITP